MQVFTNLSELTGFNKNTAVSIGNFDGVHLGHKKILEYLKKTAEENDLKSVVLTFSPHPEKFFKKHRFLLIQTYKEKLNMISRFQVEAAVVLCFDNKLSLLSPEQFIEKTLIDSLRCKSIVIGDNFRFGKNRKGDVNHLREIAKKHHIKLHSIPQVSLDGEIISSSKIRTLLINGDIEKANRFLGHPYQLSGRVIRGSSRGRRIGFPTANLRPDNDIIPPGVFITKSIIGPKTYPSVTNIGCRPTFNKDRTHIESYIIGLQTDLYDKRMALLVLKKIRDEKTFGSSEELQRQIEKDIRITEQYFAKKRKR